MPTSTPEEQMTTFLEMRASHVREYHDHKETMAHAALLVSLTLAIGVIMTCPWPPPWISNLRPLQGHLTWTWFLAVIMVALLWFGIHVYMRWQLRNRRIAACLYGALLMVLLSWARKPPDAEDLAPFTGEVPKVPSRIRLFDLFIYPLKRANQGFDETLSCYPKPIVCKYLKWKTDAFIAEIILSVGNIVLGLIIVFSMLAQRGACTP